MSAPRVRGRFANLDATAHAGFRELLRWQAHRERRPWPMIDAEPGPPPPHHVRDGVRVTAVGHATVLVQIPQLNILTDPVWSPRCSPVQWAGPKRVRPPGIRFEDLPRIDAVLLSHDHYDHLDVGTLERLHEVHAPLVFTGLGNAARLRAIGIDTVRELDWWDRAELPGGVPVTAVPARHFSGRTPFDRDRTLWLGFVVDGPLGPIYFAGDTGYGRHFVDIRQRCGPMHIALLPIGAYLPRWFMQGVHVSPAEAVQAAVELEAEHSVPIHYGTFELADDGPQQALDDLQTALGELPTPPRFDVLEFGEGRTFAAAHRASAAE